MDKIYNSGKGVNNSNALPEIEVIDATQTKGKVSAKFTLVDDTEAVDAIEKVDKNKLFAEISDYFCPVKFDATPLETALNPVVASGVMSEEAKIKAIATAKAEFLSANADIIESANNLSFSEVLAKLQENQSLYKRTLAACKLSEIKEDNYVKDGKVMIFRANQCPDKDGNDRYTDCTLKTEENGVSFSVSLFVEYREITTANILLSIRYYSSKQEAQKRLYNQLTDYRRILTNVFNSVTKAKENGFSKTQVLAEIEKVYG